jgi:hypothetical protein
MDEAGTGNNKRHYYITDWNVSPGFYAYDKHRFPQAYIELAHWYILNWKDVDSVIKGSGNVIIANTPVHDELVKLQVIDPLMQDNDVYLVQEGTVWDWFDWPAPEQELYVKLLANTKGFLYSNEYDKKVLSVFTSNFIKVPACTNRFVENARTEPGEFVYIVNPNKRYQRGMIPHKLVYDAVPENIPVYTMSYNRPRSFNELLAFPDSYTMPGFNLLPYMQHDEFLSTVYSCKFGVDINRDFSAGQLAVDFASLGIPLIGNIQLDPQKNLYPDTSFEWDDFDGIKKCIQKLSTDVDFNLEVGRKALQNAKDNYLSSKVVNQYMSDFNNLKN